MQRVYLVRHARTALNADGRLRGHLDPPLDDVGRSEARELAVVLASLRPVRVVTSPLRRASTPRRRSPARRPFAWSSTSV